MALVELDFVVFHTAVPFGPALPEELLTRATTAQGYTITLDTGGSDCVDVSKGDRFVTVPRANVAAFRKAPAPSKK
jgi:hypothetical protein